MSLGWVDIPISLRCQVLVRLLIEALIQRLFNSLLVVDKDSSHWKECCLTSFENNPLLHNAWGSNPVDLQSYIPVASKVTVKSNVLVNNWYFSRVSGPQLALPKP